MITIILENLEIIFPKKVLQSGIEDLKKKDKILALVESFTLNKEFNFFSNNLDLNRLVIYK